MNDLQLSRGGLLALIGGLWGLICAVALAALRAVLGASGGDPLPFALPGDVVFGAIYVLPFALSLAALKWGGPGHRAGAWLAASLLAAVAPITSFSLIGFVFWPSAPVLLIAAVRALWGKSIRPIAAAIGLGILIAVLNAGAFRALYLGDDGACWNLVREPSGFEHWVSASYGQSGAIDASGSGVIQARCSSDVYSPAELLLSAGLLGLAAAVWILPSGRALKRAGRAAG